MLSERLRVAALVLVVACGPAADPSLEAAPTATSPPSPTAVAATPTQSAEPAVPAASPTIVPEGLGATATASTLFDTQRTFRLELTNNGSEVTIESLVLESAWYQPAEPEERRVTLPDGARRLVPLAYGEAVCEAGSPEAGEVLGEVVARTDDGTRRISLVDHPVGLVAGRHGRECAVAVAREAVRLELSPTWTAADPRAVTGMLSIEPLDGASVEVVGLEGNIIFAFDSREALPVTVQGPIELPVRVAAARCDTHALIEAKKKFHLPVTVAVYGGEPAIVEVEATGDTKARFQELLEACLDDPES